MQRLIREEMWSDMTELPRWLSSAIHSYAIPATMGGAPVIIRYTRKIYKMK